MSTNAPVAYAFRTGTISSTAVSMNDIGGVGLGFTEAELSRAEVARITVASNPLQLRYDSGVPTATVGHYIATNGQMIVEGNENINRLQYIRATGSDAVVSITLEEG